MKLTSIVRGQLSVVSGWWSAVYCPLIFAGLPILMGRYFQGSPQLTTDHAQLTTDAGNHTEIYIQQ